MNAEKPPVTHNVDHEEIAKFEAVASRWWDLEGEFKPLHRINPLRLGYITERSGGLFGKKVLDVGCGGGILAESMAREGATVTGLDMGFEPLQVAKLHALESGIQVEYVQETVEEHADKHAHQYDVVTCMEMLEHVPDPGAIIEACKRLLKPGGHLFLSTINRTAAAFAVAIVGAEYVARLLPKGTHHYQEFIKPAELARWLREADMQLVDVSGMAYEPWRNHARLSSRTDINYLAYAVKPA